ncbi:hypothetical protein [Pseudorhodoplanes sinuspersici]|uniref:hypothetical protein n=1 Tax=Pseudorhodoplanes sinuspersici TaxID=1235591 RepID=UPI000FF7CF36|nr:hypothetical protein [Pseudorhodoplanes sinuspersici]RKE70656.1 hypothetical protein DFP91_2897 [Pseudorhodoplanes sinuspersici]
MIITDTRPLSELYTDDVVRLHRAEINRVIAEAKLRIEAARARREAANTRGVEK